MTVYTVKNKNRNEGSEKKFSSKEGNPADLKCTDFYSD